ncbi:MAG: heat-inducible transcriptional repressor HrcA [Lactobacillus sp.]|nr:heat-inducible transcriptional repressor HrcA [Lactobacillus sp.]
MLTERQEVILKTIIQDFTQTHEPVGSKTVMSQLPFKVSSATIRNEMAVLEDAGLIEKTHSSSGRIPSALGYRYYLDYLVEPLELSDSIHSAIGSQLNRPFNQVNEIVQEAAKILSDLTNYTAFAEGPEMQEVTVTGFRLVPLSPRQVMAIIVTDDGNVHNKIYSIPHNVSSSELEKAVNLISSIIVGHHLSELTYSLLEKQFLQEFNKEQSKLFLDLLEDVLRDAASEQMYIDGQINLLNNTAVNSVNDVRSLYELLDNNGLASEMVHLTSSEIQSKYPVKVVLGSEMQNDLLKHYSLLTAQYQVGKYGKGTIAILGPSSMPYSQVIGLLDYFREQLANKLLDYYGNIK